jgi:amidohydrolase
MTAVNIQDIAREAESLQPWIVERRRHLHSHPEVSYHEEKTARYVRDQLAKMSLVPTATIPGRHGFYVDLVSPQNPDQFVLLRADMDALPIQEETGAEFSSTVPGVGHLCGHDCHTSMLLGAANLLRKRVAELPVSVRLVFQHAEEVAPGGARDFIEAGIMRDVIACFGLHVSPRTASYRFGLRSGPAMASPGHLEIIVRGRGGHAAMPHDTHDPIPAAAAIVLALQQIASRRVPPMEPVVVTVASIHAGNAPNVIPGEVRMEGTYRTFNTARIPEIEKWIHDIATSTAQAWGCEADVKANSCIPVLVNDPKAIEAARATIASLFGEGAIEEVGPHMGAEDFAHFAAERPSAFVFLGALPPGQEYFPLHHPRFLPDERVLWRGAAYLAAMPWMVPGHIATAIGN